MGSLPFNQLLLFFAGWWLFATVSSFVAAALLWNRGSALLDGKVPGVTGLAMKFSGAGAIWSLSLLLFSFVNPLKEYRSVLLLSTSAKPAAGAPGHPVIEAQSWQDAKAQGVDLGNAKTTIELIPLEFVFDLMPAGGHTLKPRRLLPVGTYQLRATDPNSGSVYTEQVDVEPASP